MVLFPHCKINLGLLIGERRPDGYHNLSTVFYPVPVTDALDLVEQPGPPGMELGLSGIPLPAGPNLVTRAYELLMSRHGSLPRVGAHLHKVIPTGAGLGGGSSDGAFALQGLNRLLSLGHTGEELEAMALQLGSDCPFFLRSGPVLATGRGEVMTPVHLSLKGWWLLLVHPGIHVSTAWAFGQLAPDRPQPHLPDVMGEGPSTWKEVLLNHFEAPVMAAHPPIAGLRDRMYAAGAAYAAMSGSGSTVFGLFRERPEWIPDEQHWMRCVLL